MTEPTSDLAWRRFVVQHHTDFGPDHFDLMLERDAALWTWQLAERPEATGPAGGPARRLADHRKDYLTYEGPISRGRGRCRIVDRGRYRLIEAAQRAIVFELAGERAAGRFVLTAPPAGDDWRLTRAS